MDRRAELAAAVFEQVTIQNLADGKLPEGVAALTADEDAWQPH